MGLIDAIEMPEGYACIGIPEIGFGSERDLEGDFFFLINSRRPGVGRGRVVDD